MSAEACYPKMTLRPVDGTAQMDQPPTAFSMTPKKGADRKLSRRPGRLSPITTRRSPRPVRPLLSGRHGRSRSLVSAAWGPAVRSACSCLRTAIHSSLQFKEACPSVLAPYAGKSVYENQGSTGRRGAASDAVVQRHLPGLDPWAARSHFFGQQLPGHEIRGPVEGGSPAQFRHYAEFAVRYWPARTPSRGCGDAHWLSGQRR